MLIMKIILNLLIKLKIFKLFLKNKNSSINFKTLENIRKETLYLFTDNYL